MSDAQAVRKGSGMISLMLIAVAATPPASFSAAARDADRVVVATVVEVQHRTNTSMLEVEHVLRGPAVETLRVASAVNIGSRSLFLLKGEKLLVELEFQKKYPGDLVFSPTRVEFDGPLENLTRELPWPSAIPVDAVFRFLKTDIQLAPAARRARVVERSCDPCELDPLLVRTRPEGAVDCGHVEDGGLKCVETQWNRHKPVVLRAPWRGIDSSGVVALVGTRPASTVYQVDNDVTGGSNMQCSRAVFAHRCSNPKLEELLFGCRGESTVACSEKAMMTERLGASVAPEMLDAGSIEFRSDAGPMTCFRLRDSSLVCD